VTDQVRLGQSVGDNCHVIHIEHVLNVGDVSILPPG